MEMIPKNLTKVDFITSICSHIPNKNEQMVRYMGYYSNLCRGRRKKDSTDESDFVIEDDGYTKGANKIYCFKLFRVIAVLRLIYNF